MKKAFSVLCLLLAFTMLFSPLGYAAGKNTDTLADWNIRITVPDGKTAVLEGEEYYIYAEKTGYIPYVMLRVYADEREEDFIPAFTKYMRGQYDDLIVTAEAAKKTIGGKNCREIDYAYTISGYQAADRRIILSTNGLTYMFCSKEVPELDLTVGDMLERVVADCEFLTGGGTGAPAANAKEAELADAYLYCLDNGMPKYWLDFSGATADNLVLHCFFRSSDPTFYKSYFVLDLESAETTDGGLTIRKVWDSHGFDHSDWFKSLVLSRSGDKLVMEVERDERTLAGGGEDNVLTGRYVMEPAGVSLDAEAQPGLAPLKEGPYTAEELARMAQIYYFEQTGFYPPEADAEKNADGTFTIHLYEIVHMGEFLHTATSAWYTVNAYGVGADDIRDTAVNFAR